MQRIGITEGGDCANSNLWVKWVSEGKPAILITKDPKKLYNKIKELNVPYNIIVHLTVTGYGGSIVEPNVPAAEESIEYVYKFVELLGPDRTVLRIDPILSVDEYLRKSFNILKTVKSHLGENMCRIRISFYDDYQHSHKRLADSGVHVGQCSFHMPIETRKRIWKAFGEPETCAEEGMLSTPCISIKDCEILNVEPGDTTSHQRKHCKCLSNKHELIPIKKQCAHKCLYCFWKDDYTGAKELF
jgi:hypothetical protein